MPEATSNLAPYYGDYVNNYLTNAQALTTLPYQPYEGDRFAGPSALQTQAFSGIAGLTNPAANPNISNLTNLAATQATQGNGYTPTNFSAPGYTAQNVTAPSAVGFERIGPGLDASNSATVNSFMNPYQQGVTDIAIREAQRRYGAAVPGMDAAAARAGAFGGSRHGVMQAEAYRNLNTSLNDLQMQGGNAAYNAAIQALQNQRTANYNTDLANQGAGMRTNEFNANMQYNTGVQNANANNTANQFNAGQNLTAQQLGDQSRQFGANNYNNGIMNLMNTASGISNLGTAGLNNQMAITNAQLGAGGIQQGINQQPLDFGYQQWQESMKYPYQQLDWQRGMLQGLPLSVNQTAGTNPLLEAFMGAGGLYQLINTPSGPAGGTTPTGPAGGATPTGPAVVGPPVPGGQP